MHLVGTWNDAVIDAMELTVARNKSIKSPRGYCAMLIRKFETHEPEAVNNFKPANPRGYAETILIASLPSFGGLSTESLQPGTGSAAVFKNGRGNADDNEALRGQDLILKMKDGFTFNHMQIPPDASILSWIMNAFEIENILKSRSPNMNFQMNIGNVKNVWAVVLRQYQGYNYQVLAKMAQQADLSGFFYAHELFSRDSCDAFLGSPKPDYSTIPTELAEMTRKTPDKPKYDSIDDPYGVLTKARELEVKAKSKGLSNHDYFAKHMPHNVKKIQDRIGTLELKMAG